MRTVCRNGLHSGWGRLHIYPHSRCATSPQGHRKDIDPTSYEETDTSENITFPKLRWRSVNMNSKSLLGNQLYLAPPWTVEYRVLQIVVQTFFLECQVVIQHHYYGWSASVTVPLNLVAVIIHFYLLLHTCQPSGRFIYSDEWFRGLTPTKLELDLYLF